MKINNNSNPVNKKRLLREKDHLTRPPRLERGETEKSAKSNKKYKPKPLKRKGLKKT